MQTIVVASLALLPLVLAEGDLWWITVKSNDKLCLDVSGGKKDNGTPIDIWACDYSAKGQQWYWDAGTFKLRSLLDETKCLDANDMKQGTPLQLWDCSIDQQQFWGWADKTSTIFLQATAGGANTICMDVQNAAFKQGTLVQAWGCDGMNNQEWALTKPVPPPKPFTFTLPNTKFCLDLYGGTAKSGTAIDLWTCNQGTKGQQWLFAAGTFKIQSVVDPTKCIDAGDRQFRGGLKLWDCNGQPQQTWGYDSNTKQVFLYDSKTATKPSDSLCIATTAFQDGAGLQLYSCNAQNTEQWDISNAIQFEAPSNSSLQMV